MKHLYLSLIFLASCLVAVGKTTYIPTYYTQVNIEGENGITIADSTIRREMTMFASDGRYSITVLHDSVTAERVKAIKNLKAASGWATAAAIMSGVSATLNPVHTSWDAVRYMRDMNNLSSSTMLAVAAKSGATSLQRVDVSIVIENLSDREMVVNDMSRGLVWFVRAHTFINLSVGNPEVNKLRIAYADCQDQKKDYITIQAGNYLEKQTIEYEDDKAWVFGVSDKAEQEKKAILQYDSPKTSEHYEILDKISFVRKPISVAELKELKKLQKAEEKKVVSQDGHEQELE